MLSRGEAGGCGGTETHQMQGAGLLGQWRLFTGAEAGVEILVGVMENVTEIMVGFVRQGRVWTRASVSPEDLLKLQISGAHHESF